MSITKNLTPLFYPNSVAVVGASSDPKKLGYFCLKSFTDSNFKGDIYPINPGYEEILGLKAYPSVKSLPAAFDLAIIVVTSNMVPSVLKECAQKGVKGAVIITAGFKEIGSDLGEKLQDELRDIANSADIKIIGPNTFGMYNTDADLNASFTPLFSKMRKGEISFLSQSGGMCHTVSYLAIDDRIGLNKALSLGNRCNLDFADLLEFLGEDTKTRAIAMYIEGLEKPRELIEAARKVVRKKPVVAYKSGRFQVTDQAALSHTGSLAGNYQIYDAALKQAGVIMANDCTELFDMTKALAFCPPLKGDRVAVCSLIAGPGIVSADCCQNNGMSMSKFSSSTQKKLDSLLPPLTFRMNPLDMAFAQNLGTWKEILSEILNDSQVDTMLMIFPKQEFFDPMMGDVAELAIDLLKTYKKPIVMCLPSPRDSFVEERDKMQKNGIPVYQTPERAAKSLAALAKYGRAVNMI